MAHRSSALEHELEQLLTLPRVDIDRACTDAQARAAIIEFCIDEEIELREAASDAFDRGDDDLARHCEQEASAWRHTARVLRSDAIVTADASSHSARLA